MQKNKFVSALPGERFGRLLVLSAFVDRTKRRSKRLCKCDCGGEVIINATHLTSGSSISCGCFNEEQIQKGMKHRTHGLSLKMVTDRQLYRAWLHIKDRCSNQSSKNYDRYGGRGITYCKEWNEYLPFHEWALSNGYKPGLTIDRIDNNGNYEPSNCRWVTAFVQSRNTSRNRLITIDGKTKILKDWGDAYGISPSAILQRVKRGMPIEEAIVTPKKRVYV